MKFIRILLTAFLFLFFTNSFSQRVLPWEREEHVKVSLVSSLTDATPGEKLRIAVLFDHAPGWHTYWTNPGNIGLPTKIDISAPENWVVSAPLWPTPTLFNQDGLISFGYGDVLLVPIDISVPADAQLNKQINIEADVSWLVCKDQCIPGSKKLTLPIKVQTRAQKTEWFNRINEIQASLPQKTKDIKAFFDSNKGLIELVLPPFVGNNIKNFYIFPEENSLIDLNASQEIAPSKSGYRVVLKSLPEIKLGETFSGVLEVEYEEYAIKKSYEFSSPLQTANIEPVQGFSSSSSSLSAYVAILMAFIGGLILNLMPCVFPVLSLKIIGLVDQVNNKKLLIHGLFFCIGVLLTMCALAITLMIFKSLGVAVGWGFQLQSPWFVALLALLFVAIGLNLLGIFEFSSPNIRQSHSSHQSLLSSFLTGVLTVVIATPCSAPFMGVSLGYALTVGHVESLFIFLSLGLGLCFPWLIISGFPKLLVWLPRPGKWMVSLKLFLSVPIFLTVLWLLWVLYQQVGVINFSIFCASAIILALFLFFWGRIQFGGLIFNPLIPILGFICITAYMIASLEVLEENKRVIEIPNPWSEQIVDTYLREGKAVFVDFTASWCLTCQANKVAVLDQKKVREAFKQNNVQFLIADWTNRNEEISRVLAHFGRSGVPLYVLYGPNNKIIILPEILTIEKTLNALKEIHH